MGLKEALREAAEEKAKQQSSNEVDTAGSEDVNVESSKGVSEIATSIELAALTVRVPRRHRKHWLISAKKEDTTLTAAITEALNARFGEPAD